MNTNSAFSGCYTENQISCQHFDHRKLRILRRGKPIVDFQAADKCRLFVTTVKAMNFQYDIPTIPTYNLKEHYVLVFDFNSMQDATGNCDYPELIVEPL